MNPSPTNTVSVYQTNGDSTRAKPPAVGVSDLRVVRREPLTLDQALASLRVMGCDPVERSGSWSIRCPHPEHEDSNPSATIKAGDKHPFVVHCFGGCDFRHQDWWREVARALDAPEDHVKRTPTNRRGSRGSGSGSLDAGPWTLMAEYFYRTADGREIMRKSRYLVGTGDSARKEFVQSRPFSHDPDTGEVTLWVGGLGAGGTLDALPLYLLPELVRADLNQPVYLVEGEKDADRLNELGHVATCSPKASGGLPKDFSALSGRHVVIIADRDTPGAKHAELCQTALEGVAESVEIRLPRPEFKGADVSDHIGAGYSLDDLELVTGTLPESVGNPAKSDATGETLTRIRLGSKPESVQAVAESLGTGSLSGVLKGDTGLVYVPGIARGSWDGRTDSYPIERHDRLAGILNHDAYLYRDRQGVESWEQLAPAVGNVVLASEWRMTNVRKLNRIVDVPTLDRAGNVVQTPGYHDGYVFLPCKGWDGSLVPERPTVEDAHKAITLIQTLLADFPFEGDDDRASMLAGLMAPALRDMTENALPILLIQARSMGSGKTLLGQVIKTVWDGFDTVSTLKTGDEAEIGKSVLASLAKPKVDSVVILDNAKGVIGGSTLEALTTSSRFSGRLLGTNINLDVPNSPLWVVTSNNATVTEDLVRRVMLVGIDPRMENPNLRSDIRIKDLLRHVAETRAAIATALVTMIRYGLSMGEVPRKRFDTFGAFVETAQHVLAVCGIPGTVMAQPENLSPDAEHHLNVMRALLNTFGETSWTVGRMLEHAATQRELHEVLLPLGRNGRFPDAQRVGMWLTHRKGRIRSGLVLERRDVRTSSAQWHVKRLDDASKPH